MFDQFPLHKTLYREYNNKQLITLLFYDPVLFLVSFFAGQLPILQYKVKYKGLPPGFEFYLL